MKKTLWFSLKQQVEINIMYVSCIYNVAVFSPFHSDNHYHCAYKLIRRFFSAG